MSNKEKELKSHSIKVDIEDGETKHKKENTDNKDNKDRKESTNHKASKHSRKYSDTSNSSADKDRSSYDRHKRIQHTKRKHRSRSRHSDKDKDKDKEKDKFRHRDHLYDSKSHSKKRNINERKTNKEIKKIDSTPTFPSSEFVINILEQNIIIPSTENKNEIINNKEEYSFDTFPTSKDDFEKRREERQKRLEELKKKNEEIKIAHLDNTNKIEDLDKIPLEIVSKEKEDLSLIKMSIEDRMKLLNMVEVEREKNLQDELRLLTKEENVSNSPSTPDMFAETPIDAILPEDFKLLNPLSVSEEGTGYYSPQLNEILNEHYKIIGLCGKGIFSNVVKVIDIKTNKEYAIKIIRSIDVMLISGEKERSILKKLNEVDKKDRSNIIRLIDSFDMKRHICMVFELYEMNLRDLLKSRGGVGLPLGIIKSYAQQLLYAFDLIHKYKIIHADYKPDNTVVNKSLDRVRLCDFGSALQVDEVVITSELVSRFYRAPEILLGHHYDTKIDIWSLGCSLFELYTGKILFPGRNNNEMVKLIMQAKGKVPQKILKRAQYTNMYFNEGGDFLSQELDNFTKKEYIKEINVNHYPIKDLGAQLKNANTAGNEDPKNIAVFQSFLDKCLHLDPKKRLSALDALTHEFIGILPIGIINK